MQCIRWAGVNKGTHVEHDGKRETADPGLPSDALHDTAGDCDACVHSVRGGIGTALPVMLEQCSKQ